MQLSRIGSWPSHALFPFFLIFAGIVAFGLCISGHVLHVGQLLRQVHQLVLAHFVAFVIDVLSNLEHGSFPAVSCFILHCLVTPLDQGLVHRPAVRGDSASFSFDFWKRTRKMKRSQIMVWRSVVLAPAWKLRLVRYRRSRKRPRKFSLEALPPSIHPSISLSPPPPSSIPLDWLWEETRVPVLAIIAVVGGVGRWTRFSFRSGGSARSSRRPRYFLSHLLYGPSLPSSHTGF